MSDNKTTMCKTCMGPTEGYKCGMCGAEAGEHDPNHKPCGGDHCLPKCQACNQAETKCTCTS